MPKPAPLDPSPISGSTQEASAAGAGPELSALAESPAALRALKPVLVHDYLLIRRGAERCFTALCDMFPGAPVATLLYDESVFEQFLDGHEVSTSWLQTFKFKQKNFKMLLPLLARATERLPVSGHELVVSSSSAFAHGVNPDDGATHACYCYTPFRYAWYEHERALKAVPSMLRPGLGRSLANIQAWDLRKAQRPTEYIAISQLSRERIREYWGRDAQIVYPPVELDRFAPGTPEDFFLVVGELVRHKQVEVALAAALDAHVPIRVVGGGVDEQRLRSTYGSRPEVEFLGRVSDRELSGLYARARAVVMPGAEEFGITAVEAQASGRPVIAADVGGARETVIAGQTGIFYPLGDVAALARAFKDPSIDEFREADCIASAKRFSLAAFQSSMAGALTEAVRSSR